MSCSVVVEIDLFIPFSFCVGGSLPCVVFNSFLVKIFIFDGNYNYSPELVELS